MAKPASFQPLTPPARVFTEVNPFARYSSASLAEDASCGQAQ